MILAVDITQAIVAILNFTIPALIVFGVTYYLVQSFLNEQRKVRIIELKKEQANALTPIKLQAYERMTLFLERMNPSKLLLRVTSVNNDKNSSQYMKWEAFTLSESNRHQILVPPKFGNGHLVLSEKAIFHYKQSTYYNRDGQFTILWDDPDWKFWWPSKNPILSMRDSGLG